MNNKNIPTEAEILAKASYDYVKWRIQNTDRELDGIMEEKTKLLISIVNSESGIADSQQEQRLNEIALREDILRNFRNELQNTLELEPQLRQFNLETETAKEVNEIPANPSVEQKQLQAWEELTTTTSHTERPNLAEEIWNELESLRNDDVENSRDSDEIDISDER